jgi:hypothetical protein
MSKKSLPKKLRLGLGLGGKAAFLPFLPSGFYRV